MSGVNYELVEVSEKEFIVTEEVATEIITEGEQGPPGPPGTTNPQKFTVTYGASVVVDWSQGDIGVLTLTGNAAVAMSGTRKKCMLAVVQGGIGGFAVTWDTATVNFGSDIPNIALTAAQGKTDYIGFVRNELTGKYDVVAYARGY